jgi:hypothetical protein
MRSASWISIDNRNYRASFTERMTERPSNPLPSSGYESHTPVEPKSLDNPVTDTARDNVIPLSHDRDLLLKLTAAPRRRSAANELRTGTGQCSAA